MVHDFCVCVFVNPKVAKIFYMLFRGFTISAFMIEFLAHLELIFMSGMR